MHQISLPNLQTVLPTSEHHAVQFSPNSSNRQNNETRKSLTASVSRGYIRATPGPGAYSPEKDCSLPSSPKYTLSRTKRKDSACSLDVPGPGTYNFPNPSTRYIALGQKLNPKFVTPHTYYPLAGSPRLLSPGPGAYSPTKVNLPLSPKFSISRTPRFEKESRRVVPGPGTYDPILPEKSPGGLVGVKLGYATPYCYSAYGVVRY